MSREALSVGTGLIVLVIGVIALVDMTGSADKPPIDGSAPSITTVPLGETFALEPVAELPGIGPAVNRVLQWSGNARFAGDDELAQLPPTVAALLIDYGVPLRVPDTSGPVR
jgi:hypothetical protein